MGSHGPRASFPRDSRSGTSSRPRFESFDSYQVSLSPRQRLSKVRGALFGGARPVPTLDAPPPPPKKSVGGKIELTDDACWELLGFAWPSWKKWSTLSVIFLVQVSMNLNASLYANGVPGISEYFDISMQEARVGQMVFLVAYAFGSELWAPWSEEFGRWPVLQLSLFFVNVWQLPAALSQNYATIVVARFLGGLSSAGGSVTMGMVADMWDPDDQQYAVAFIVFSSVGGSVIGPIFGGFIEQYWNWRWLFWVQLIVGCVVQFIHFFSPETRVSILIDREAKRRRAAGERNIWGPSELRDGPRITFHEVITIWTRPFVMFIREPIVLCLSLLSGFSDALIFTCLSSYPLVFKQWNFNEWQLGLTFAAIGTGYIIGYASFIPFIHSNRAARRRHPDGVEPESRLYWLLFTAPLETIGLVGFALTSLGPSHGMPWIAPLAFSALIGIANYAIYMATIDYMVAAYGPYSASATGSNALARNFLAGTAALYATPLYQNLKPRPLQNGSILLACLALVVTAPLYLFYFRGEWFRKRSKFALVLAADRKQGILRRASRWHAAGGRKAAGAEATPSTGASWALAPSDEKV